MIMASILKYKRIIEENGIETNFNVNGIDVKSWIIKHLNELIELLGYVVQKIYVR
jgi:hypothetical protein